MALRVPAATDGHRADAAHPTVVIYTHSLLERSMTFIRSHAEALTRYRPVYAGAHRVQGLELPADRVVTANRGGLSGPVEEFLFRSCGLAGGFAERLRAFGPVVLHAHFGLSGPSALTLADALGIPLVITYHGQDATITDQEARKSWRGREYLRGRALVMERAAIVIAVSDFIRSRLIAKGYPEQKVVTHRNGIDLAYFRRGDQVREKVVVFVGRFVEKKGCEYLIRALASLRQQGHAARGVLVGDGPLRPMLERLAADSGADVVFAGFRALPEVRDWLARASVVAVPSVTAANGDSEGLPTVILEAQAMGTPVVVTRHAGNAEGVVEGRSALVVAERDVDGLAEAMRFFLEDRDAVESFGSAGRTFVETQFDIAAQARGLERLYDTARSPAS
jgi:glycosyltransferase involved in cell wall biosynthesis